MDKELVRLQQNEATLISAMMRILKYDRELGLNIGDMEEYRNLTELIIKEALGFVKGNQ